MTSLLQHGGTYLSPSPPTPLYISDSKVIVLLATGLAVLANYYENLD